MGPCGEEMDPPCEQQARRDGQPGSHADGTDRLRRTAADYLQVRDDTRSIRTQHQWSLKCTGGREFFRARASTGSDGLCPGIDAGAEPSIHPDCPGSGGTAPGAGARCCGASAPGTTTDAGSAAATAGIGASADFGSFVMRRMLFFLTLDLLLAVALGSRLWLGAGIRILPSVGPHTAWYASRAAGVASYLFLWAGLVGGLLMSSAWLDGIVGRGRLLAIHQSASIAGVLLGLGHGLVLMLDGWTHFGLKDVLIPFASYYRPSLTAVGTLALYLSALVTISFWFRSTIGPKMWKRMHYASVVAYVGALWHGLMIGTDAREPWLLALFLGTSMAVVFGVVIRISYRRPAPARRAAPGVTAV